MDGGEVKHGSESTPDAAEASDRREEKKEKKRTER